MQWDNSPQAGFSFGKDIEPWLPVNDNYPQVNVNQEFTDPESILNFYQALIKIRKKSQALQSGSWRSLIHYPYEHLVYLRDTKAEQVLVVINFSEEQELKLDEELERQDWQVLLSTDYEPQQTKKLPEMLKPFETSTYQKNR